MRRALERHNDLGGTHPDGSLARATRIETLALQDYRRALMDFNQFVLFRELPEREREREREGLAARLGQSGALSEPQEAPQRLRNAVTFVAQLASTGLCCNTMGARCSTLTDSCWTGNSKELISVVRM